MKPIRYKGWAVVNNDGEIARCAGEPLVYVYQPTLTVQDELDGQHLVRVDVAITPPKKAARRRRA